MLVQYYRAYMDDDLPSTEREARAAWAAMGLVRRNARRAPVYESE